MLRSINLIRGALTRTNYLFIKSTGSQQSLRGSNITPALPLSSFPASKSFHTQSKLNNNNETNIDRSLLSLDKEIRRSGRINRREIEEILGDIRTTKQATSSQSLMIIRCCGELVPGETPENRTKLVQEVWKTMESLNVPVDISHYNALLKVYLENEHKFDPEEFLQNLSNKGIEPNRVTYQRLIAHFCQQGNIDGATTVLQHMKEKQLPINEHVFNSLILGHAQAKDMQSAEGMLGVMRQAGLEPNDDTFVTLLTGYAKIGDMDNFRRIVQHCEEKDIFLVDRDFLNVIYVLATNGQEHLVDEVFPHLRKHSGFNQEATNVILRLVSAGKEEIAYRILQLMPRGKREDEFVPSGTFFIKQMVLSTTPTQSIISYCRQMHENELNVYSLSRACEIALTNKKFDKAVDLLEALKESGFPIRQHYFWPFFAGKKTEKEVFDGLKCMNSLGVPINSETVREYVVPALFDISKPESFSGHIDKLSFHARIPVTFITPCVLQYLLTRNDLKTAANFASRYSIQLFNANARRALLQAYKSTMDTKSLALIIANSGGDNDDSARELAGLVLLDCIESSVGAQKLKYLNPLLSAFEERGLGISNSTAELVQNSLGEMMTPEITNKILKLTSADVVRKVERVAVGRKTEDLDEKSVAELEVLMEEGKKAGGPIKGLQKTLLLHYCKERDLQKAEKLLSEMKEQNFAFGLNIQSQLLDLYSDQGLIDKAREVYNSIQTAQLDFVIMDYIVLRYIHVLTTNGHHAEALDVIKEARRSELRKNVPVQSGLSWKILNGYAEQGKTAEAQQILDSLVENNFVPVNNNVLGPIIKSYLARDDLEGAMKEFERCVHEHHCSPYKQELCSRFIKAEDADRLQKVLDLSTSIHGEVNSLYDLVFAFLECGKVRQAKKILDTPGLQARNEKLEYVCQSYLNADRVQDLEKLIEITKDVFNIDRNSLYNYLLKAYIKQGDPEKALSVWTSLQEENVQASDDLLVRLADFLQKNDKPVPFVLPTKSSSKPIRDYDNFKSALKSENLQEVLKTKARIENSSPTQLTWGDKSGVITLLVRAEKFEEAINLIEELAGTGNFPKDYASVRTIVEHLKNKGDIETLNRLSNILPQRLAAEVDLRNCISDAYFNAGREDEFFQDYVKAVVESKVEDDRKRHVSPVSIKNLLEKRPEYITEVEAMSEKCAESRILGLNAGLWYHYMLKNDFKKARDILQNKIQSDEYLAFRDVINAATKNLDLDLANELWSQVSTSHVPGGVKGLAAGCLLDVLRSKGDISAALQVLDNALKVLHLTDFRQKTLIGLKTDVEKSQQQFPYEIPKRDRTNRRRRGRKNDSSSSDSDSDSD